MGLLAGLSRKGVSLGRPQFPESGSLGNRPRWWLRQLEYALVLDPRFPLEKASSWHEKGLILGFLLARNALSATFVHSSLPLPCSYLSWVLPPPRASLVKVGADKVRRRQLIQSPCQHLHSTAIW